MLECWSEMCLTVGGPVDLPAYPRYPTGQHRQVPGYRWGTLRRGRSPTNDARSIHAEEGLAPPTRHVIAARQYRQQSDREEREQLLQCPHRSGCEECHVCLALRTLVVHHASGMEERWHWKVQGQPGYG